jgi:hypothetical protein
VPRLIALLIALFALAAAPAAAQTTLQRGSVEDAVEALRTDPVYVSPGAQPGLSTAEQESVERAITDANAGPVYVAVLEPDALDQAGGDAGELLRQIATASQRPGTYVLAVGRQLRAGSTRGLLGPGDAGRLAAEAIADHRAEGLAAILRGFVRSVGEARANGGRAEPSGGGGGGGGGGLILLGLIAIPLALFGFRGAKRRREERAALAAELEDVSAEARRDVVALGDDIRALDLDIEMPGIDPAARDDYSRALAAYERAGQALDRARRPEEFGPVTEAVEEGRYAIVATKARLEGRQPPERRPPCFFDPRHGPSVRDVEWAPPGGALRPVPACAADAVTLEEGRDPAFREVMVGGQRRPYYDASPAYAGWAGGFYGGFGGFGFFPGLMMGTMLGGAMMGGFGADAYGADYGGGDTGGGDFGDFGGGLGGGDFGGGGFGDFGGGDF